VAGTREAARMRMIRALESYVILGIRTIVPFLIDVLKSSEFIEGNTYTNFIDRNFKDWTQNVDDAALARIAYVIDELTSLERTSATVRDRGWPTPWEKLGEWRI
jgi:acetyl/propionyl-CoA carboxylase alpha subunit